MLKPEEAKKRIARWQVPEGTNRLAEGVQNLPTSLRELATWIFALRDGEATDDINVEDRQKRVFAAAVELDRCSESDRAKVFAVLAPQLVAAMERTWQLLKSTPFQKGYYRKAFRAPRHPDLTAQSRAAWLRAKAALAGLYQAEVLTPAWLATWAAYLGGGYAFGGECIGPLLAAVLNENSAEADEVFEILRQSLTNEHEIGATGRHVYTALLLSNRRHGWELMEKTLLAAQRQEGLRQAILESIDETHPEAFRRMLRLILEEDLIRFSSVVRAVDVWFGQLWSAASAGVIKKMLAQVVEYLDDTAARGKALDGKDAESAFLALWCAATEDAVASVPLAEKLLQSKSVEHRYAAARHLANLDLDVAAAALVPALADGDLRVAVLALPQGQYQSEYSAIEGVAQDDRFEQIERLLERIPREPQKLKPLVWPWTELRIKRSDVAVCLLHTRGARPATRLIPHLSKLEGYACQRAVEQIIAAKPWDEATRTAVVSLAGDASAGIRELALAALLEIAPTPEEVRRLEAYLTRKSGDLRRGILAILLKRPDIAALESAARLLAAKDAQQRMAGLELLRLLSDAGRSVAECRKQAADYRAARPKVTNEEQAHLDEIAKDKAAVATLDDALGLMNAAERTPVVAPRNIGVPHVTPAAVSCIKALDERVHEHRETAIKYKDYVGNVVEELLGNVTWGFPSADYDKPRDPQRQKLPLAEIWQAWFDSRGEELKDKDGLELVRALAWLGVCDRWSARRWTHWAESTAARTEVAKLLSGGQPLVGLRYERVVGEIVEWLVFLNPGDARDYLLDALETAYSLAPDSEMSPPSPAAARQRYVYGAMDEIRDWRDADAFEMWEKALARHLRMTGQELSPSQVVRAFQLKHWFDQPYPGAPRRRVDIELLLSAYSMKAASLADVADHLLAPRGATGYYGEGFDLLTKLTDRSRSKEIEAWLAKHPEVQALVDRAVARILDLELNRGDAPSAATDPAYALSALRGIETLRRILHALGKADFKLGQRWGGSGRQDRRQTLTQLAKVTFPAEDETPEAFTTIMKAAVRDGQFPEERLLQLAFLAPQWTRCVEGYMGWDQMSEGVYWFLAHMQYVGGLAENAAEAAGSQPDAPDGDSNANTSSAEATTAADDNSTSNDSDADAQQPEPKKLSAWERLVLERTPLTDQDRSEGAIDVAWFRRTHEPLGDKRWQRLAAAARFAANASQAKRAARIADVLLNKVKRQQIIDGIKKRQLKDDVRLLGLLPLAKGPKRDADLELRCRVLQDYRRYANQLSGLTKPSALRAWEIGMKNLALTAGFADPLRLQWAVGADAVKDLAKGPVSVSKTGVTVTLALDEQSKPLLTVTKGDKELKSIPPAVKKDKKIAELTGRVADLKRQASAIRQSLETSMCRGDTFTGDELRTWCVHALLAPLLARLVVVGEGILGYPDKGGKALRDYRGKLEPVKPKETLRLAHPHDLLASKAWQHWQRECFQAERVQPFKQVFRELYVVTKQEKSDGAVSHRYDGQQIQPRQALALFGNRGWNTNDGIFKVFHDAALTASVHFQSGVTTPLEVEGWTLAGVSFTRQGEWKPVKLSTVPPRLFSEVMRDLDLVVSVAHAGGVDPEASASTVEMRLGLLRETCTVLKLKNVRLKASHAMINGELANYSVHLGSGVVHKLPGGALCIVPVHSQHRGRLFLPFADDDPRTAEVVAKVLLLSRDREIQDPTILEQITR